MIVLTLLIFIYFFWGKYLGIVPLLRAAQIESALLHCERLSPISDPDQPLSKAEIQEVLDLINAPKRTLRDNLRRGPYTVAFTFKAKLKNHRTKNCRICLCDSGDVIVTELDADLKPLYSGEDETSYLLYRKSSKEAFRLPVFRRFYSSSTPIFPLIFAEGRPLVGGRSSSDWKYETLFNEWSSSRFEPTMQQENYELRGRTLNILFPLSPKKQSYALYDKDDRLIESGDFRGAQFHLPSKRGEYRLELIGAWNHRGSLRHFEPHPFTGKASLPNSFSGETKTVLKLRTLDRPDLLSPPADTSERFLLLPLEESLKAVGADYQRDPVERRLDIHSSSGKSPIPVQAEEKRLSDMERQVWILDIEGENCRRNLYFEDGTAYMKAEELAGDLGLRLMKKREGEYFLQENDLLYPLEHRADPSSPERFGYIDRKGDWIVPPLLKEAEAFDGDYASFVFSSHPYDLPDLSLIEKSKFRPFLEVFEKALAEFPPSDHKAVLDSKGLIAALPKYKKQNGEDSETAFEEALDYQGNNILFINSAIPSFLFLDEGRKVPLTNFPHPLLILPLKEGLLPVLDLKEETSLPGVKKSFGYFDLEGRELIPPSFATARPFVGGRAVVGQGEDHMEEFCRLGVIDREGRMKLPCIFDYIEDYSENMTCVLIETNHIKEYAYADAEGNMLTELRYQFATGFHDGRALVNLDSWNLGYIDKDFEFLKSPSGDILSHPIRPSFEEETEDESPEARSERDRFYIEPFYEMHIPHTDYFERYRFSEGLAPVFDPDKGYGYMDGFGEIVIPCRFPSASPFRNGMAKVDLSSREDFLRGDRRPAYVDRIGRIIESPDSSK